jgi:hypothetical protein
VDLKATSCASCSTTIGQCSHARTDRSIDKSATPIEDRGKGQLVALADDTLGRVGDPALIRRVAVNCRSNGLAAKPTQTPCVALVNRFR